ncbi:hypothetical protein CTAYLR_006937 [Chrysophaeum taylorii]|uniref:Essential protein Yae1 N-terminal domain-containing protein n=1 Tax=Chrysophaeum taylorii TaxID=2483200 RepID=A0AAD7UDZ5_9STRA|nr:hypothetical protein CTAYLR_006937 [Chrysophaeum taylorii]
MRSEEAAAAAEVDVEEDLEGRFADVGRAAGVSAGLAAGIEEGRPVGVAKGFEVGSEIGFYIGACAVLRANGSSRAVRAIEAVEEEIRVVLAGSLHELDVETLRSKFRLAASKARVPGLSFLRRRKETVEF